MKREDDNHSILKIAEGVSIAWEKPLIVSTVAENVSVESAEQFELTLHVNPRADYEHLDLTNKQAKKLRDWLDVYLLKVGMY